MKPCILAAGLFLIGAGHLSAQSGSINNTLGSGGTFGVKGAGSDSLLIVKDNGNVGIGTANPSSPLDVAGQLTADRVKVDGVPSFFVTHVEQTGLGSSTALATWNEASSVATHDNSGSFDASTGVFTVPRDGFYFLSAYIEFSSIGLSGASLQVKSGLDFTQLRSTHPVGSASGSISIAGVLKLQAGTAVTVVLFKPGATSATAGDGYFSGYLVSDF